MKPSIIGSTSRFEKNILAPLVCLGWDKESSPLSRPTNHLFDVYLKMWFMSQNLLDYHNIHNTTFIYSFLHWLNNWTIQHLADFCWALWTGKKCEEASQTNKNQVPISYLQQSWEFKGSPNITPFQEGLCRRLLTIIVLEKALFLGEGAIGDVWQNKIISLKCTERKEDWRVNNMQTLQICL